MRLDPEDMSPALLRLKRAYGQLGAVIRMIEQGRECDEVLTQLAAVAKAIDRAGYKIIAHSMRECLAKDPTGATLDPEKLEKLFLSLA
ncbi:transcriptional regulator [Arachnia propionica]|uniref:Transcriptional regulator n=1 Tax=Arachnia propionica TaxID=1750 RepID=A0A3P1TF23_9ACTN|nr:metal-sensitive transcriptional regulator [Arachnia propionica]MDO5083700.1 metal-sensitive transcriptional regulator [Arachnia propionica]RRD07143.1 transcriptional regulator [Arachnia propionica]